jgi:hypothetical protein
MTSYVEAVRMYTDTQIANKSADLLARRQQAEADWRDRLKPLEERLAKLLSTIPVEIKREGLSLPAIQTMLAGKWRGKCHPGELGQALRKLGYVRSRHWSETSGGFTALWYAPNETLTLSP